MPKVVGGVLMIVALAAGIFGGVEPILCMQRAAVALVVGLTLGAIIQALQPVSVTYQAPKKTGEDDSSNAPSGDAERAA